MANNQDKYRLTPEQHEKIFQTEMIPDLTMGLEAVTLPKAVMLGGQPGAGKSALQSLAELELANEGGVLAIIGDELRDYHPLYRKLLKKDDKTAAFYTDRDSGQWVGKLIDYTIKKHYHLIIEGTMRRFEVVQDTMKVLREAGYYIDARVIAVNRLISLQGIYKRYEQMVEDNGYGRFTTFEAHDAGYYGMPKIIEQVEQLKLADRVSVYNRCSNTPIYENFLGKEDCSVSSEVQTVEVQTVIENERSKAWSEEEKKCYIQGWDQVIQKMKKRNATQTDFIIMQQYRNDDFN
jgi:predicted ABC-type ATPase